MNSPISPAQLETLKTVTLQKASLDAINMENIPQLVQLIENQTQYRLHPLTLQRFYGLVPAKFGPSYLAITALCNFCGYRDPRLIPPFLIVMNNLQ